MAEIIETSRLTLRRPNIVDIDRFLDCASNETIFDMTELFGFPPTSENFIERIREEDYSSESGTDCPFWIYEKESGDIIGGISLSDLDRINSNAKITIWIAQSRRSLGFASEASKALVDFGFEKLALERIYGECSSGNPECERVYENAGMMHEGLIRHKYAKNGEYTDVNFYGIIKSDWQAERTSTPFRLETERLIIRTFRKSDVESVRESFNDPVFDELTEHIKQPYTIQSAKDFIRKATNLGRKKIGLYYAVELKETGRVIGEVHLSWIFWQQMYSEFGFAISPKYWNKGYGTEAAGELLRYAFEDLGMRRIVGMTMENNAPSRRLMEKLGMKLECVAKEEWKYKDGYPDFAHYVILKSEWK
ncbi:MAG: GNAT family N-acetyltransferase [bacterium]